MDQSNKELIALPSQGRAKSPPKAEIGRGFFGEPFIEQRSVTEYYTPYTFSAKERDLETGYSYFGARYYNSTLSIWLSVDPMGDKAPGWTPYRYGFNSPNVFVDIDGRFETRKEARQAKQEHGLPGKIRKSKEKDVNGFIISPFIISSKRNNTVYRRALPGMPQQVNTETTPCGVMATPRISAGVTTGDKVKGAIERSELWVSDIFKNSSLLHAMDEHAKEHGEAATRGLADINPLVFVGQFISTLFTGKTIYGDKVEDPVNEIINSIKSGSPVPPGIIRIEQIKDGQNKNEINSPQ